MDSKLLTRTELEKILKNNDNTITLKKIEQTDNCSSFWPHFSLVAIITYKSSTGTGGLKKHLLSCEKYSSLNAAQPAITTYYKKTKSAVPEKIKEEVTNAYIEFVALDGNSFNTLSRSGFKQLIETVFKAGQSTADFQSFEACDLLPHPTTVSRKINQVYAFRKKQLIEWCNTLDSYVVVVDMWTEKYTGIHFCGATLRSIDSDFHLHLFSLGCKPYTLANQTAPNIRKFIDDLLADYNLSLNPNSFIVSDNEPKMLAALRGANRVGCSDHYLNKILEHSFTAPNSDCVQVIQVFDIIKTLVANFRRSHRQDVFNIAYNELIDTFCGSHYHDFESIDKDLLQKICEFLQPFDETITILSDESQPTLHKVIPLRKFLIEHCVLKQEDLSGIKKLKQFLKKEIIDLWPIQNEHLLATLLHPRLRDFSGDQVLRHEAIQLLQSTIDIYTNSTNNNSSISSISSSSISNTCSSSSSISNTSSSSSSISNTCSSSSSISYTSSASISYPSSSISISNTSTCSSSISNTSSSSSSISNISSSSATYASSSSPVDNFVTTKKSNILSLCYDKPRTSKPVLDEVSSWLQTDFDTDIIHDDLLLFWRNKKETFPNIAKVARKVLAVPAANTSVERQFSCSKIIIGDRRTRLGAEKLDKLIFLQKNLLPLKLMFDSKTVLTSELKRKADDIHEKDEDNNCTSKKLKFNEEYEYLSDDYESEREN
ncbi:unnamed protein product [Rotaria sordida]|uniref:HAT C-terminal dimerisation domain-containing protein n=1 Tax=Rotaria sordida TaxID=392033 RepID=A0A819YWE4_9BILA|nr:unnamed protein product [Rotaria sordida]